jgi:hypothetical protein
MQNKGGRKKTTQSMCGDIPPTHNNQPSPAQHGQPRPSLDMKAAALPFFSAPQTAATLLYPPAAHRLLDGHRTLRAKALHERGAWQGLHPAS